MCLYCQKSAWCSQVGIDFSVLKLSPLDIKIKILTIKILPRWENFNIEVFILEGITLVEWYKCEYRLVLF